MGYDVDVSSVYRRGQIGKFCLFETLARQENEMGNRRAECEQDKQDEMVQR